MLDLISDGGYGIFRGDIMTVLFPGVCVLLSYRGVPDRARAQFDLLW